MLDNEVCKKCLEDITRKFANNEVMEMWNFSCFNKYLENKGELSKEGSISKECPYLFEQAVSAVDDNRKKETP